MQTHSLPRRQFILFSTTAAATGLLMPRRLLAAEGAPTDNPAAPLKQAWTNDVNWANAVDVAKMPGDDADTKLEAAQQAITAKGGGVAYFPAGTYTFKDDIKLRDGVILRGATPKVVTDAKKERYDPPTKFEFPKYKPVFQGDGTPIDTAFKGITLANPAGGRHTGVVNIDINRGHIDLGEDADHKCAGHRIVFGCVLRNAAVADPRVPDPRFGQHKWQRFTQRHHAAIDVVGENVLIANNRLPKSGDDNFTQKGFVLKPHRGKPAVYDVTFDYDNRPGLYINHYCVGGAGGSGNDGTPDTHPYGFRKGTVIVDNYVYNTGRMCIGFSGDGTVCARNVTRIEKDVWRPTNTGHQKTTGSSTNDNRAIEMRGWRWVVEDNDCVVHKNWAADRGYYINDGEGLMHEDHCNSTIRDSVLKGNKVNSYISIYKCGPIDGLLIEGNDVSTPGAIADIFVVANRNSGDQPCRNAHVVNNVTRSNGILIAGSPASGNVVKDNVHKGDAPGYLKNEAKAKVSGNRNYDES